ncbi:MAG: FG-GAP repeat protein [Euryarchaeota archaeon]|nr:FG-GAP repeat protein [Euryarchaeota archaeon]
MGARGQGLACVFVRSGGTWSLQANLTPDGEPFGDFGAAVAIDGNSIAVGGYGTYIYARSGSTWTQQAALSSGGWAVDVSGNTVVTTDQNGEAFVFVRSGSTWSEQDSFTGDDTVDGDNFGDSAAIDGDTVVVGAGDHGSGGAAYAFVRILGSWSQQHKFTAAGEFAFGKFDASIDGNRAAFFAVGTSSERGRVYVFLRTGTTWAEEDSVDAGDGANYDRMGVSLDLDGDYLVAGAWKADVSSVSDAGAAYVFTRSSSTWTQQQKLTASDGSANDWFGHAVALDGDTAIVGAGRDDTSFGTNAGSGYAFVRSGTTWSQEHHFMA